MSKSIISFKNIYCKPVTKKHINEGWLSWMNNSLTTKYIFNNKKKYTELDLLNYLNENKSLFFLACYSKENLYFGNLRIYEINSSIVSFGRLIGCDKHKGKGYGKLMCDLAKSLIFNEKNYQTIVVGNKKENTASAISKLKSGFKKMDKKIINISNLKIIEGYDYYQLNKSDYY